MFVGDSRRNHKKSVILASAEYSGKMTVETSLMVKSLKNGLNQLSDNIVQ